MFIKSDYSPDINKLEFSTDQRSVDILAMSSTEGEKVPFSKIVKARGNVENWLLQVEQAMALAVKHHLRAAIVAYLHVEIFIPSNVNDNFQT